MSVMGPIEEKAKKYADFCHYSTNHLYDTRPYSFHLRMVRDVALRFIHLIPVEFRDIVLAGCWVHDSIEDARQTYNDVKQNTSVEVAEIAYALTNEKGKNRAERANDKYYLGIKSTPFATFVKLCDRIANIEYSKSKGGKMISVYAKENPNFEKKLYSPLYEEMFEYIRKTLLSDPNKI